MVNMAQDLIFNTFHKVEALKKESKTVEEVNAYHNCQVLILQQANIYLDVLQEKLQGEIDAIIRKSQAINGES